MIFTELLKFDSTLSLIKDSTSGKGITRLTTPDHLEEDALCFVKNIKFLKKFTQSSKNNPKKSSLIIETKIWESLSTTEQSELKEYCEYLMLSPNVAYSLTYLSKPFYDLKYKGMNYLLDGRQTGTANIHPETSIAQNVFIGEHVLIEKDVMIAPGCVILPHSIIGSGSIIYPNVTIYPWTSIGQNVRIHANSTIGSDGFGYTFINGQHVKIWHMGGVEIHSEVEIGSNSTVDMGTFTPTIIGQGTKIDNGVQIAHNVKIGKNCVICGHAGLGGSAVLEDFVILAGKAGVGPDAHLGKGVMLAGAAIVNEGAIWPAGSKLGGHPARELKEWMKGFAYLRKVSLSKDS